MAANTITLPEALALLDGPHAAVVSEIGSAGYTLWLGSGISRGRVIGLSGSDGVIAKLIEFLRAKRTAAADCKFNQALETLLTLAELDVAQRAALDLTVPVKEWPADQLKPIVGRLWNKYSEVLSIDIEGEKQDFLLWTGLDFPNTFADQDPDLEHLALAILVLEGVAPQLATANWDGLIEGAIVELGYPKEHLAITVTGDDLRNAAGAAAKLYKFHGCALRAIESEAIYRPLLIARSGQIGRWKYENAFTIVRQQLGALIQTTRTLMIGLSGQDENIRDMFQKVGGDKPWPWKEPPAVVFSNDALTQDQKDILEGIYSTEEWSESRTDICTSSLIESYGRPLLPAIVLHILTQKLQVLASDAAAPNLGPDDRERLDNGIVHLRDKAAEAGQSDLLVLMRHVAAAVARVRHQVEIGESPAGRLKYFPMSSDPVPRMKDAIGLKATGQREAATALGVIGDIASTGDWTIDLDNPEKTTSGALRIGTDGAAARVFFAANDHVINGLLEAGAFNESDPDVVVVSAAPLRTRQTRSPSGVYRNAKPQARFIEFGPMLAKAANTDDLVRSFRWERRSALDDLLNEVDPLLELPEDLEERRGFEMDSGLEEAELGLVGRLQANLDRVRQAWAQRGEGDPAARRAELEQTLDATSKRLAEWQTTDGARFADIETLLAPILPDLPPFATDPMKARDQAETRARAETVRCQALLTLAKTAADTLTAVKATIQRANVRIAEIDAELAKSAADAQSLAKALASVAPHVHDETCPVCARDFQEEKKGSLSAFIASRIADLTSEASRLQSLATERAAESKRLAEAQRQQLSSERELLPEQERADLASRIPKLNGALVDLAAMTVNARVGASIMNDLASARSRLNAMNRIQDDTASAVAGADQIVRDITSTELAAYPTVAEAFEVAASTLSQRAEQAEADLSARSRARSLLSMEVEAAARLKRLRAELAVQEAKAVRIAAASQTANARRLTSRAVADAADKIRSSLVTTVFNTSLNNRWRDLFVRLAPTENFVPAFELKTVKGKTEAHLKTLHRSGVGYGNPGAMLSQGNLNTAALTLFLALHLSVPAKQPWLILDDPVQSMDDVHIAQFAALLRTLSKRLGRQIVIAVHERALFDYLALELSPAFSGDSLLTVEITRGPDGMSSADPKGFGFETDQAIAA